MKRCKHLVTSWTPAPDDLERADGFDWDRRTKETCVACGQLLPLGPAADSPAALCELRAAELALALTGHTGPLVNAGFTADEVMGWVIARHDLVTPPTSSQHSGYLARIIYEHKEEA